MNTRKDRLMEVYEHLRKHHSVHTKKDLAIAIGQTQPTIYSAFGGNEDYLTDSLFRKINATYKNVFDLGYLLTGKGSLLTAEEELKSKEIEGAAQQLQQTENVLELYARMIRGVDDLRVELKKELEELRQARDDFRAATAELKAIIDQHSAGSHLIYNINEGPADMAAEVKPE